MKLENLKEHVTKLAALLEDPQPGLATWNEFLGQHFKAIHDGWDGNKTTVDLMREAWGCGYCFGKSGETDDNSEDVERMEKDIACLLKEHGG
jgi:hypothetical protein